MARDCTIRHPVLQIVTLQRRVRFSARLAGFGRVGITRDALEGLKRPHFRFWSLISIFECHVCAKGGSGSLTGPCSVGKETARGVQNQGQGYHGVAGQHVLVQVQPGPGSRSPSGSVASRCWTVFSLRVRGTRIADIASDTPQIWGSPWVDDESKRPGAPVLSPFVFLDRTGFEVIGFCGMRDYDGEKIYPKASSE